MSRCLSDAILLLGALGLGLVPGMAGAAVDTLGVADDGKRIRITLNDDDDGDRGRIRIGVSGDREVTRSVDHVRFGESVHIRANEHVLGDVVTLGGGIRVDGEVTGDCVAVMGKVELGPRASVGGEVVSVGGGVILGDSSEVFGDVVSVGGRLDIAPSAVVHGELEEVSGFGIQAPGFSFLPSGGGGFDFVGHLVWAFVLIGLGVLAFHVFPTRMAFLADTVQQRGLVSFLAGFAGWILWLPIFVILLVTVIGIPVALILLFLTPLVIFLGYVGVGKVTGTYLLSRGGSLPGVGVSVLVGILVLEGALLLSRLTSSIQLGFLGLILGLIGCGVIFLAATTGFGAFLITRFRPAPPPEPSVPAPPPVPPPGRP